MVAVPAPPTVFFCRFRQAEVHGNGSHLRSEPGRVVWESLGCEYPGLGAIHVFVWRVELS